MTDIQIIRETIRQTPDGRLTRRDAATFIGMGARTLANWRSKGRGPRQTKVGGRVFYQLAELERFVAHGLEH